MNNQPTNPVGPQQPIQPGASPPQPPPASVPPAFTRAGTPYLQPPVATGMNGYAVASLICSLAAIFTAGVGALLGVILGHIALAQFKRNDFMQGRGLAVVGLVIGYAELGIALIALIVGLAAQQH